MKIPVEKEPRHILMISNHAGAIRLVSLMKPEQQEKLKEVISGDQAIAITFSVPQLTILMKCDNGSLICLKGV